MRTRLSSASSFDEDDDGLRLVTFLISVTFIFSMLPVETPKRREHSRWSIRGSQTSSVSCTNYATRISSFNFSHVCEHQLFLKIEIAQLLEAITRLNIFSLPVDDESKAALQRFRCFVAFKGHNKQMKSWSSLRTQTTDIYVPQKKVRVGTGQYFKWIQGFAT